MIGSHVVFVFLIDPCRYICKKYCCIIFHVFLLTENSACQTKCEVKIENVSATKNILLDIEYGTPNTNFLTPCGKKKGYTELTMFINCPNWNAGKCIRQGNQFSINILQFYSYYVYHPLFPVTLIVYSYYLWHIQNRFKLNWIQFKCWNFKLFRHLSIIIYLIINCFGRNTLKKSLLSFFFPLKRTKFTYFSNACF